MVSTTSTQTIAAMVARGSLIIIIIVVIVAGRVSLGEEKREVLSKCEKC
jgi:hypothetical protein